MQMLLNVLHSRRHMKLLPNLVVGELACQGLQKLDPLLHRPIDLAADRHKTARQRLVILHQQANGDEDEVDIVKYQSPLLGIGFLLFQERYGVVSPVSQRIKMV